MKTAASAARIAIPAPMASREKTRSPTRALARPVSSATTVVATCYLIQGCHAPVRRTGSSVRRTRCWAVRGGAPDQVDQPAEMPSTMPWAFSATVLESGAEPASSDAACWPSSDTM